MNIPHVSGVVHSNQKIPQAFGHHELSANYGDYQKNNLALLIKSPYPVRVNSVIKVVPPNNA